MRIQQLAWLVLVTGAAAPLGCSGSSSGNGAQLPTCEEGDLLQYIGGQWTCGAATNLLPTCATGQTAFWDGIQWSCANFVPPPPTCMDGDVLQQVNNAWTCQPVPLPKTMGCMAGEALTWDGMEWSCGPDISPAPVMQTSQYAMGNMLTPRIGQTMSATKMAAASGDCIDIDHNWGTGEIGAAAWFRASGNTSATWTPSPADTIQRPDDNTVRFCNSASSASDLALVIWH